MKYFFRHRPSSRFELPRTQDRALPVALFSVLSCLTGCSSDPANPPASAGGASSGGEGSGGLATGGTATGGAESGGAGGATGGAETGGTGGTTGGAETGGAGSGGDGTGGDGTGGAITDDLPELLSETGLYVDAATGELGEGVEPFAPQFLLWSDGATKKRWAYLPEGEQIDTSDMDNWVYPTGTKLWKEFTRDGVRVETRLLTRTREGGRGWKGVAYIWNEAQTDAVAAPDGMENASGTEHDVPDEGACRDCHGDRPDWPLGFGAVQLSHMSEGLTVEKLAASGALSAPPTEPISVPGSELEQAVLGYLHANCGSCHRSGASGTERSDLAMWLNVEQLTSVEATDAYTGLVNQEIDFPESVEQYRVLGGNPEASELYRRFTTRGSDDQMPALGTELVDEDGASLIAEWINSLPPPSED